MNQPIYKDDLETPSLPISGDNRRLIQLYRKRISAGLQGTGKLTDRHFSCLSHFYQVEDDSGSAKDALNEGLSWFPGSQLLLSYLLRLIWFQFRNTPENQADIKEILVKLEPTKFGAAEKAFFGSFYDSLHQVERVPELEEITSMANSVNDLIGPMNKPHHYNGGWELDLSQEKT